MRASAALVGKCSSTAGITARKWSEAQMHPTVMKGKRPALSKARRAFSAGIWTLPRMSSDVVIQFVTSSEC